MSKPLHIVYIQNARLPTEKAHGYQIMKTCEALARQGVRITLVVAARKNLHGEKNPFSFYNIDNLFSFERIPVVDWLPYVPKCLIGFAFVIERASFICQVFRMLSKWSDADVLFTRDPAVAEILVKSSKPVIVELHDDPRSNKRRWNRIKDKIAAWVVISEALKTLLTNESIPADRICVASDGFDADVFAHLPSKVYARAKLGVDSKTFLVVYTGHLFPWKGIDVLAPSFDKIPVGCELVIVGGNSDDLARVKRLVPVDAPRVRFIGHVLRDQALLWMAAADAAILPTSAKFEIGRLYTSPLKLFEYLAAGLPIIASDVPSSREILDESMAMFFEPDNTEHFLQTIERLFRLDEGSRARMATRAKESSVAYSWSVRGKLIGDFIELLRSFF